MEPEGYREEGEVPVGQAAEERRANRAEGKDMQWWQY